ncbi:MAG: hypothetical protein ACHQ9S_18945 [Candidatus Binatia bacterium]
MSQDLQLFSQNTDLVQSSKYAEIADDLGNDLTGGISGSYAILSIKGSRFSLKYKGDMTPVTNPDNGDPVGSLELVLVKANPFLTKQYYVKGYVEGDSAAPDCFSIDGKVPAAASPHPQHANCATCPQNTFSKINEKTGKKTKPCQDNKKMAVLPLADLKNEIFGGPMLMRVPAASLGDLATFGSTMKARGYAYNAVAVRVSFDLTVSYPKLVLKAIRPLTDAEAEIVIEWYKSDVVDKMLADFSDLKTADAAANPPAHAGDQDFEIPQEPAPAPVKAAAPPPPPPAVKPTPKAPPAQPVPTKSAGVSFGGTKAAAPPSNAAPAAPATAAKPAPKPKATKPAPAPAPVAQPAEAASTAPEGDVDTTTEVIPGNLDNDIAGILDELNQIAG